MYIEHEPAIGQIETFIEHMQQKYPQEVTIIGWCVGHIEGIKQNATVDDSWIYLGRLMERFFFK